MADASDHLGDKDGEEGAQCADSGGDLRQSIDSEGYAAHGTLQATTRVV
jgi:hypothetical protein